MSAECQLDNIRRINFLRSELECSLRISDNGCFKSGGKRPLNILFRTGEAAQIQFSGPPTCASDQQRSSRQANSRFTVSPTPNAPSPAKNDDLKEGGREEGKKSTSPLRIVIIKGGGEEGGGGRKNEDSITPTDKSISIPTAGPGSVIASSPASSIDSGVASPGANDFLLFGPSPPTTFPSWATIPRTKRHHVFNFSQTTGSLIEALALPGKKQPKTDAPTAAVQMAAVTLQKPPAGKKPQCGSSSSSPKNNLPSQSIQNGSSSFTSSISSLLLSSSSSIPAQPVSSMRIQRQFSEGSSQPREDAITNNGLPPRAATMPPLKSILKKPKTNNGDQQNTHQNNEAFPRNHQRHMPTRIVLFRSISEGMQGNISPTSPIEVTSSLNEAILRKLTSPQLDAFEEHLEECEEAKRMEENNNDISAQTKVQSSSSSCSTETIDSEDYGQHSASIAKKRVSFSEHVQARIYRSNSSILGQRRKNEKKAKQRANRRCNSDETEQDEDMGFSEIEGGPGGGGNNPNQPSPACRPRESASVIFPSHPSVNSGYSVLAQ